MTADIEDKVQKATAEVLTFANGFTGYELVDVRRHLGELHIDCAHRQSYWTHTLEIGSTLARALSHKALAAHLWTLLDASRTKAFKRAFT